MCHFKLDKILMISIKFKYYLDGKEIQKIDNMFDNENFTFKIDGDKVFFTTVSSPVSKFFSAEKEEKQRWKDKEQESINNFVRFVENTTQPPHLKFTKNRCNGQCLCDGSCKDDKVTGNHNSTRHKYNPIKNLDKLKNDVINYNSLPKKLTEEEVLNIIKSVQKKHLITSQPAQNVQEALKSAEQYQAKNGREESLETERFGNFLLDEDEDFNWNFTKLKPEEEKVISDWEKIPPKYQKFPFTSPEIENMSAGIVGSILSVGDKGKKVLDKEVGAKETAGKLDYSEINFNLFDLMAKRFSENKHKYGYGNTKKPLDLKQIEQATFRHLRKMIQPIEGDEETYLDHLCATATNLSIILDQLELRK